MADGVKLNLGAGGLAIPGYEAVEIHEGQTAYPLARPDNSVDEIRASHLLEHFSHRQTLAVLKDWVRALKPGGLLKVAVPDLDKLIDCYQKGDPEGKVSGGVEGQLLGGHADEHDIHKAIFNGRKLRELMELAGLSDIQPWTSEIDDCAALPATLNLQGQKLLPGEPRKSTGALKVAACMSVPRLAFMDNLFCCFAAFAPMRIPIRRHMGAFWGQCLEKSMEETIADTNPDIIIALDYDTIFTGQNVVDLLRLMLATPDAIAIGALQVHRIHPFPLCTIKGPDGKNLCTVNREMFMGPLTRVSTLHFGLTVIRTAMLKQLPKPWFHETPGPDGTWNTATKTDSDISFWRLCEAHNRPVYMANRVPIGHADLMIRWPDINLNATYQATSAFFEKGAPEGVWK